jgi:hypothetical protein
MDSRPPCNWLGSRLAIAIACVFCGFVAGLLCPVILNLDYATSLNSNRNTIPVTHREDLLMSLKHRKWTIDTKLWNEWHTAKVYVSMHVGSLSNVPNLRLIEVLILDPSRDRQVDRVHVKYDAIYTFECDSELEVKSTDIRYLDQPEYRDGIVVLATYMTRDNRTLPYIYILYL